MSAANVIGALAALAALGSFSGAIWAAKESVKLKDYEPFPWICIGGIVFMGLLLSVLALTCWGWLP